MGGWSVPVGLSLQRTTRGRNKGASNDRNPTLTLTSYTRISRACHGSWVNKGVRT